MTIFLENMPEVLDKLNNVIQDGSDWDAISKQAHFLKSSTSVVKVGDMFDKLYDIEKLTKISGTELETIKIIFAEIQELFIQAHPILLSENERYKKAVVA